ncbi:probable inactive peptidyl-prolyl cis-trans isomerase-like 6 isoform X2 [Oncorhynchus keta]|uniref:probable inactive peptidyl-prolyl cis-trans isomerase-like 6 isoform X2 n=1 Tax=Oncorhynchus keta TaxID=8018 RepID=UPI0015FCC9CD|nr:probable inactive peptidyl-prolyl cis-trans isomerase-like 6 isoform X2 [Oncorhynchus keta]
MTSEVYLEIVGLMKEHHFQIAKSIAEELKGEVWQFSSNLMCFVNGCLLGNEKDLTSWAEKQWEFTLIRPHALYLALADDNYSKHLHSTGHTFVYMDISIRGDSVGRLLFEVRLSFVTIDLTGPEWVKKLVQSCIDSVGLLSTQLFTELCPKTCTNFQALCTGEAGLSQSELILSYKGSVFHRVVPNGWIQGGDISAPGKGNGGESIYGPTFEDESFAVSHSRRGILGMANQGPHSNSSQFYITLQPALWMDRQYVAFGQVVEGTEVLRRLEEVPTYNERPKQDCKVADCGVFEP